MDRVRIFRRVVLRWARLHSRSFSWRDSSDPFAVLVGEVLLQRTRGENVEEVYREVLRRWPTPELLARARTSSIAAVIRPLGLSKRAAVLKDLGGAIAKAGEVPTDPRDLERLPGIGPYAARAVPVFALDHNLPLVDWVIARVLRRVFGLSNEKRPNADRQLWRLAEELVAGGRARDVWLGTLDFAAEVCRPRPRCGVCPLGDVCAYQLAQASHLSVPELRITPV